MGGKRTFPADLTASAIAYEPEPRHTPEFGPRRVYVSLVAVEGQSEGSFTPVWIPAD